MSDQSITVINGDLRFYEVRFAKDFDWAPVRTAIQALGLKTILPDDRGCLVCCSVSKTPNHEDLIGQVESMTGVLKVIPCNMGTTVKFGSGT